MCWPCCFTTIRRLNGSGEQVWRADDKYNGILGRSVVVNSDGEPVVLNIGLAETSATEVKSVIKYSTDGEELWTYSVQTYGAAKPSVIAVDSDDNVYILTTLPFNTLFPIQCRIIKLDTDGVEQWVYNPAVQLLWIGINASNQLVGFAQNQLRTYTGNPPTLASATTMKLPGAQFYDGIGAASRMGTDLLIGGSSPQVGSDPTPTNARIITMPKHASGTYTLTYRGDTTTPITYAQVLPDSIFDNSYPTAEITANMAAVQAALDVLPSVITAKKVLGGTITCTVGSNNNGSVDMRIHFHNIINPPVNRVTADFSGITYSNNIQYNVGPDIVGDREFRPAWRIQRFNMTTGEPLWILQSPHAEKIMQAGPDNGIAIADSPGITVYTADANLHPVLSWTNTEVSIVGMDADSSNYYAAGQKSLLGNVRAYAKAGGAPLWEYIWPNHNQTLMPQMRCTGVAAFDADTVYAVGFRG